MARGQGWSGNIEVNWEVPISSNELFIPDMVCFCDIPDESLSIHTAKYGRFGIAFKKSFLLSRGANPVYYVATSAIAQRFDREKVTALINAAQSGHAVDVLTGPANFMIETARQQYFDEMMPIYRSIHDLMNQTLLQDAVDGSDSGSFDRLFDLQYFLAFQIFSYIKFFDPSLAEDDPDNYYMEREWRSVRNVPFELNDVCAVLVPEEYVRELATLFPMLAVESIR